MKDKITAALKHATHPGSPGELAKLLDVEGSALSYHLKSMLDAGTLKAAGSSRARRIGLPDHDFTDVAESSAAQPRKKHKKAKHAKRHARTKKPRAVRARATAPAPAAERFIPTCDAERRLVIVNGGEPQIYTEEQTVKIASLLFQHYDKE